MELYERRGWGSIAISTSVGILLLISVILEYDGTITISTAGFSLAAGLSFLDAILVWKKMSPKEKNEDQPTIKNQPKQDTKT